MKDSSDTVISAENFTHDTAGNITGAPDSCFRYDTNNRLTMYNCQAVSYDMDGNMLSCKLSQLLMKTTDGVLLSHGVRYDIDFTDNADEHCPVLYRIGGNVYERESKRINIS